MAFPGVSERQCAGALVSHADRGAERRAQDNNDRGTGAQVTDRAVAPGHDRRGSGRCRIAAGSVSNTLWNEKGQTGFGTRLRLMRRVADDDPRWRQSASGYGCNAAERMAPPPRRLARRSV